MLITLFDFGVLQSYICFPIHNVMSKQTAEEQLRQHAQTLGVSMRDLRGLVMQVYIDDENFQKRQHEAIQNQVNAKQLRLLDLQLSVEGMRLTREERKLRHIAWRINAWNRVKKVFTKKKEA